MLMAALVAFLSFDQPVAVIALLFLSLGDPLAAVVGSRAPGFRVFGKSPVGTLGFVVVSLLVVLVLVATGYVPYHWGLVLGAVIAALVELAPLPVDDNLAIPLASGMAMQLLVA